MKQGTKMGYESGIPYKEKGKFEESLKYWKQKNSISQIKCSEESHTDRTGGKFIRPQGKSEDLQLSQR